jgi:hypothetical protein
MREGVGAAISRPELAVDASYEAAVNTARKYLGASAYAAALDAGRSLDLEDAVDEALGAEANEMESGAGPSSLSDALLDSICLLGPIERCQQRLAEYRAAGVDLPILMAPIGVAGARAVIEAFSLESDVQAGGALAGASTA